MQLLDAFDRHPVEAAVVAGCCLVAMLLVMALTARVVRAMRRGRIEGQRVVTLLGAAIATGLSAQGMYVFFRDSVEVPPVLRVVFFAFLEIMVLGSALRAKASMREKYSAGIDGIAMWAFTVLSAILAATHAHGLGETLFRLSVPLAAAWAWEREMKLERRRRTGRAGLNWTLTPERVLIRLGLADPTDRTASEVGAQHRLMRLALAAKKARVARDSGNRRAYARSLRKLDKAMDRAAELTGLGTDPTRKQAPEEILVGRLSVLYNTESLLDLQPPAPWTPARPSASEPQPPAAPVPQPAPDPEPKPPAPVTVPRQAAPPQAEQLAPPAAPAPAPPAPESAPEPPAQPAAEEPAEAPAPVEEPAPKPRRTRKTAVTTAADDAAPVSTSSRKRKPVPAPDGENPLDSSEALWPFPPRRTRRVSTTTTRTVPTRGESAENADLAALETPLATPGATRSSRRTRTARSKTEE